MLSDEFCRLICGAEHQDKQRETFVGETEAFEIPPFAGVWSFLYIHKMFCTWRFHFRGGEGPVNDFLGLCVFDPQDLDGILQLGELRVLKKEHIMDALGVFLLAAFCENL